MSLFDLEEVKYIWIKMASVQRRIVHKQFNSPIAMYSDNNVKETLNRELKVLSSGAVGWVKIH